MGFYHHLYVLDQEGNKKEIGGYSKGGSETHWLFAFTPEEYHNNLSEVMVLQNPKIASIGYTTTVRLAIARLKRVIDLLHMSKDNLKRPQTEHLHYQLSQKVWQLHYQLERENPDNTLFLDRTGGFEYALHWDGETIVGMKEYAFHNPAEQNETVLAKLEETISYEEAVEQYALCLPHKEILDFQGELYHFIAHEERSYGPSAISLFLSEDVSKHITSDNPQTLFKEVLHASSRHVKNQLTNLDPNSDEYKQILFDHRQDISNLFSYIDGYLRFADEHEKENQQ